MKYLQDTKIRIDNLPKFYTEPKDQKLGYEFILVNGCPKRREDLYICSEIFDRCTKCNFQLWGG